MGGNPSDAAYRMLVCVTGGLIAVLLLRLPLRYAFGPRIAYLIWLLIPITTTGSVVGSLAPVNAFAPLTLPVQVSNVRLLWAPSSAVPALFGETNWIVACWMIGVGLFALIQWWQQYAFVRRLGNLQRTPNGVWISETKDIGPAVVGALSPKIVLPTDFYQRYTTQEQALVLAHESTHINRCDPMANLAAATIRSLWWFNPLVHLAIRYFRIDQEFACDAAVLTAHPRDQYHYAHALLKGQIGGSVLSAGCCLDSNAVTSLKRRIIMLQAAFPNRRRRTLGAITTFALLLSGLVLTLPTAALAQTTLANLTGTWAMHLDNGFVTDVSVHIRPDSTFTLTIDGHVIAGRATRLAGDTLTIQAVNSDTQKLETVMYVVALSDRILRVHEGNGNDDEYVFKRFNTKP